MVDRVEPGQLRSSADEGVDGRWHILPPGFAKGDLHPSHLPPSLMSVNSSNSNPCSLPPSCTLSRYELITNRTVFPLHVPGN